MKAIDPSNSSQPQEAKPAAAPQPPVRVDDFIEAYEATHARDGQADLRDFLPPATSPLYDAVLHELIRVEMEYGWRRGQARSLEDYQREFPEAFADPVHQHDLAFEEYRLRLQAGDRPSRAEYEQRFAVITHTWPESVVRSADIPELLVEEDESLGTTVVTPLKSDDLAAQMPATRQLAELFRELHNSEPQMANQLVRAISSLPEVGDEFLGFRLLAELGRGAFGRVYLAEQPALANRCVALKISADVRGESQHLAQLLHTNVVPIYSLHDAGALQAACMPFLGAITLADLLKEFEGQGSLPQSGKGLISTLQNQLSSSRLAAVVSASAPPSATAANAAAPGTASVAPPVFRQLSSTVILELLRKLSYVDAVLWLGSRLADGLAHAHERGILHCDLKPANILLTDEGQPMLLDFNLSEDTKLRTSAAAAQLGGTLPYMSPEQLDAFAGRKRPIDGRSDLFSLGIILYQLLAMRFPFALYKGQLREVLTRMIADRRQPPPSLHQHNRAVSPAVEAIIRRCLQPDPQRRYQSARQLQEDLDRQLAHQPLKHTPEPSLRERAHKWARRHPRLTSTTTVSLLALVVLSSLLALLWWNHHRLQQWEALNSLRQFQEEMQTNQMLLTNPSSEVADYEKMVEHGTQMLKQYRVMDDALWREEALRSLPEEQQRQLSEEIGVLLFLLARATERLAETRSAAVERKQGFTRALELNALAEECFGKEVVYHSVLVQRSGLWKHLGRQAEAKLLLTKARNAPPTALRDKYLTAREYVIQNRLQEAKALLQGVLKQEPTNAHSWFLLGRCHDGQGQYRAAIADYTTGIALWPKSHPLYFNRGLAHLHLHEFDFAAADFDRVVELQPQFAEGYLNRAVAREQLKRYAEAEADLSRALELGLRMTRLFFFRSRIRAQLGNEAGKKDDFAEGLRRLPTDELSWNARGYARLETDPWGALEDFDQALRLNPRSVAGLDNKSHVLAEHLANRSAWTFVPCTWQAILVLDTTLKSYPDNVVARATRGVLYARLGERTKAHQDAGEALRLDLDARKALQLDSSPAIQYQVGGIYALTSATHPEDRAEALRLLASALAKGYGLEELNGDPELHPLRSLPAFKSLVNSAKALKEAAAK